LTDVFLSYAREDRDRIKPMAKALEAAGLDLWWDVEIAAGQKFARVIDSAIKSARCIIVVWSQESVKSDWVYEEAEEGRARDILVPVMIDEVEIPRGFRSLQAADLRYSDFNQDPEWQQLVERICALTGATPKARPHDSEKFDVSSLAAIGTTAIALRRLRLTQAFRYVTDKITKNGPLFAAIGSLITLGTFAVSLWPSDPPSIPAPDLRGEVEKKAAAIRQQAAAQEAINPNAAINLYEEALRLIPDDPRAMEPLGSLYYRMVSVDATKYLTEAERTFQSLLTIGTLRNDFSIIGAAWRGLGMAAVTRAQHGVAADSLQKAIDAYRAAGDLAKEGAVISNFAELEHNRAVAGLGSFDKSIQLSQEAIAIHQKLGNSLELGNDHFALARTFWSKGDLAQSAAQYENALELYKSVPHKQFTAVTLRELGTILIQVGQFEAGVARKEEELALWREFSDAYAAMWATLGLAWGNVELGRYAVAEAQLNEALGFARKMNDVFGQSEAYRVWAHSAQKQNIVALACQYYSSAWQGYSTNFAWAVQKSQMELAMRQLNCAMPQPTTTYPPPLSPQPNANEAQSGGIFDALTAPTRTEGEGKPAETPVQETKPARD
jgi:tetratricopeptide (TPR) repeat protein